MITLWYNSGLAPTAHALQIIRLRLEFIGILRNYTLCSSWSRNEHFFFCQRNRSGLLINEVTCWFLYNVEIVACPAGKVAQHSLHKNSSLSGFYKTENLWKTSSFFVFPVLKVFFVFCDILFWFYTICFPYVFLLTVGKLEVDAKFALVLTLENIRLY